MYKSTMVTDAYKMTHWNQYPEGTTNIYSYLESRGGAFEETTFFGLQMLLTQLTLAIEPKGVLEGMSKTSEIFGHNTYNIDGWMHILDKNRGMLPLEIKAVPEGTTVPAGNVLMTIENTDPAVPWLTNWAESILMQVWYPATVCTLSRNIKKLIKRYADKAGEKVSPFHLNDFGLRGATSMSAAQMGGAAHLVNFLGSDNLPAILAAQEHYGMGSDVHTVVATEHSTTTAWGEEGELDFIRNILRKNPGVPVSLVADSYNLHRFVREYIGGTMRKAIQNRGPEGKVIVRPDSGNPPKMCRETLDLLWHSFGGTTNPKGFRVLDPCVGVIYGDGINYGSIGEIMQTITDAGYAPSNVVLGMGGGLLQQLDRDTHRFAIKCSSMEINGKRRDVFKRPSTDPGKNSKRGRLMLTQDSHGDFHTVSSPHSPAGDMLKTVFLNGEMHCKQTMEQVRERAAL